jgi:inosose dehydratase
MGDMRVGCGQITWVSWKGGSPRWTVPEEQVLAEIAQAGYDGAPAAPSAGRSAEETLDLYSRHGLVPAPGYLGAPFWEADQVDSILDRAGALARFMRAVGCIEVYVAASGFDYVTPSGRTRAQTAGQVAAEDSLTDAEFRQFADMLNRVGEVTLEEGVTSCFHSHVGTVIETREEVDRLFAIVDRSLVFMGPDTGHLAWAGADVTSFFRDYASSIKTAHLKDINRSVMEEGRAKAWTYQEFTDHGVFAELGEGLVDFPAILDILEAAGFRGWLIAETDVTRRSTALESATVSREYLKQLGI